LNALLVTPVVIPPPRPGIAGPPAANPAENRTPVPGADKGGTWGDGILSGTGNVDTTTWKQYDNSTYGYSFRYPANWTFFEYDSSTVKGPGGVPVYPLQSAYVKNPVSEWGNPGDQCPVGQCVLAPPGVAGFSVDVNHALCGQGGIVLVHDSVQFAGKPATRCVLLDLSDRATRTVMYSLPYDRDVYLVVTVTRGRGVKEQSTLEAILGSFVVQ